MIEAMKLAFADRAELMGDPDHVKVPVAELISKEYAIAQRNRIRTTRTTPSSDIRHGLAEKESDETTHFSVIDAAGNVVSNTYTLNGSFGSGDTVVGAGILLNNEMDDFAANPGKPNMYGLIQGERNAIVANKRPLSSMTPTIVLRDGKPILVVGSPGGPTIINTVLQVILNSIDHKMNLAQAVQAPRIHHQWMPDETSYESPWISSDTLAVLSSLGHKLEPKTVQGVANCIAIDPRTGARTGMADKRYGDATAVAQ
jgi:gamma-glutamyltranspeptidase/glutathione hydrolase